MSPHASRSNGGRGGARRAPSAARLQRVRGTLSCVEWGGRSARRGDWKWSGATVPRWELLKRVVYIGSTSHIPLFSITQTFVSGSASINSRVNLSTSRCENCALSTKITSSVSSVVMARLADVTPKPARISRTSSLASSLESAQTPGEHPRGPQTAAPARMICPCPPGGPS